METMGASRAVVVTAEEVRAALPRARTLSSEEEKTLRMRYGAECPATAPLPRAAGANEELGDELLLMEVQILRAFRARKGLMRASAPSPQMRANVGRNAVKEKIVRSLRKKR